MKLVLCEQSDVRCDGAVEYSPVGRERQHGLGCDEFNIGLFFPLDVRK